MDWSVLLHSLRVMHGGAFMSKPATVIPAASAFSAASAISFWIATAEPTTSNLARTAEVGS